VSPYSRPQLWVLLAITALGGLGIAVGAWRRAHPDLTERMELLDAETPAADTRSAQYRTAASRESGAEAAPAARARARAGTPTSAPTRTAGARPSRADRAPHARPDPAGPAAPSRIGRPDKRQPAEGPLDLNRATVEDLKRLPGVGPGLAQRIIVARGQTGRFASVEDLEEVPGIGPVKFARLRDLVRVSP
jgi:competence ComEA-like helix-hairpin-helix protein